MLLSTCRRIHNNYITLMESKPVLSQPSLSGGKGLSQTNRDEGLLLHDVKSLCGKNSILTSS